MIYESLPGERIDMAALEAVKAGCDKLLHNDRIYKVKLTCDEVGELRQNSKMLDDQE